jgi:hypothetical protein
VPCHLAPYKNRYTVSQADTIPNERKNIAELLPSSVVKG